jgi:predicted type IV restriction endonuclease
MAKGKPSKQSFVYRHYQAELGSELIWSHITYHVKPEENLSGRPDFLIARPTKIVDIMDVPPLCVIEVKKDNWEEGWAQALAEMYAASLQGATVCYAVVTSGEEWQFGKFDKQADLFTKDKRKLHATDYPDEPNNLQRLFDTLNWVFDEASKVEIKAEDALRNVAHHFEKPS